jgi:hypothetical protein
MTLRILSDSETGRRSSYTKEVDEFIENGLTAERIPQGTEGIEARQDLSTQGSGAVSSTTIADMTDQAGALQNMALPAKEQQSRKQNR